MTLNDRLRALPAPALPRDLTSAVLTRVEQFERRRSAPATEAHGTRLLGPSRADWATAVLSALAAAALGVSITTGQLPLISMLGGFRLSNLRTGPSDLPLFVTGLALYALGLFSSLRPDRRAST
jgi:hypothetical protein